MVLWIVGIFPNFFTNFKKQNGGVVVVHWYALHGISFLLLLYFCTSYRTFLVVKLMREEGMTEKKKFSYTGTTYPLRWIAKWQNMLCMCKNWNITFEVIKFLEIAITYIIKMLSANFHTYIAYFVPLQSTLIYIEPTVIY